jgi:hypothetical protein
MRRPIEIKANLHKCALCDCNATTVFKHCKFCRHTLKNQGLCGQCGTEPSAPRSLYCGECKDEIHGFFSEAHSKELDRAEEWYRWREKEKKDRSFD